MSYDWLLEGGIYYEYPARITALIDELPALSFPNFKSPVYIDSGAYKDVWDIGDNKVFVLYQDHYVHKEYLDVLEVWRKDKPWKIMEPRIFSLGNLSAGEYNFYWAVTERFITTLDLDEVDENISDIILEVDEFCYSSLNPVEDWRRDFRTMTPGLYQTLMSKSEYCYNKNKKKLYSSYSEELEWIEFNLELNEGWVKQLIENYMFKLCTDRDTDLHSGNIGFRISDKRPVFFDW